MPTPLSILPMSEMLGRHYLYTDPVLLAIFSPKAISIKQTNCLIGETRGKIKGNILKCDLRHSAIAAMFGVLTI